MAKDPNDPQSIRDRLAQPILERIYFDQKRANDQRIRALLEHFRTHLSDENLELIEVYKTCGIPQNFAPVFRSKVGENPQTYLLARRLELACRLLEQTTIEIYAVGILCGYKTGQGFSQGFKDAKGMRPSIYRAKNQRRIENPASLDPGLCEQIRHFEPKEAKMYRAFFYSEHPELLGDKPPLRYRIGEETYSPNEYGVSDQSIEHLLAERLWLRLQGMDRSFQREVIWEQTFETSALFDLLKLKTVDESRRDRFEGLRVARLALDAAMSSKRLDSTDRSSLWARAWAWLGNAHRLLFDHDEAERCMILAEQLLPTDAQSARAEVHYLNLN